MSVTCAICLASYEEDEAPDVVVIRCGHAFHRPCLLGWKKSSKQMSCPECRTKYTVRTLTKLYLNVLPKEPEVTQFTELHNQLQRQLHQSEHLQRDKERMILEKSQMESELIKSKEDFRNLMQKADTLNRSFAIKCQEYSLINGINDEYLKTNKALKDENKELKNHIGELQQEVAEVKVQQLRTSKPFVDLTCDDDSDIEIVEEDNSKDNKKTMEPAEIIDLDNEKLARENMTRSIKDISQSSMSKLDGNFLKNSAASMGDSSLNDLKIFENFILEQI